MESRPSTDITYGRMLPRITAPIMPPPTLPRFRWQSQRHLTPTHCGNCRARLIVTDIPTADERLTDLSCLMCSRVAAELISDAAPTPMTAEQFRALPTPQGKRGPKPIYAGPPERMQAYRQRVARGEVVRTRWATDYDACVICGLTEHAHNGHGRCLKCRDRSQEPYRAARRTGR